MEHRYRKLMRKVKSYLLRENRKTSLMGNLLRRIGVDKLLNEHYWKWNRRDVSVGAGWGAAAAVSPLPLQSFWAILACLWRKGNIPIGILMAWLSPPFFMLGFTPVQWGVGHYIFCFLGLPDSKVTVSMIKAYCHQVFTDYQFNLAPLKGAHIWVGLGEYMTGMILTCTLIGLLSYALVQGLWISSVFVTQRIKDAREAKK